jgi:hypothetical protein
MFAEPVHLLQKGLCLHLNRLNHCLPHAQQYLHALILQIEAGYVSPQGDVHAFLHEKTSSFQLAYFEYGAIEDVAVVDVCL